MRRWQDFLRGQGFDPKGTDGVFGADTLVGTKAFQTTFKIDADGVVGDQSYGHAAKLGFAITEDDQQGKTTANVPPPPSFAALTHDQRVTLFGSFEFVHQPVPDNL